MSVTYLEIVTIICYIILVCISFVFLDRNWDKEDSTLIKVWIIFYMCIWTTLVVIYLLEYNRNKAFQITNIIYYLVLDVCNIFIYGSKHMTSELQNYILSIMVIMFIATFVFIWEFKQSREEHINEPDYYWL